MKCEDIKELLTEYLDGELPPEDAAAVEEHTAGCDACRAELDALRQTTALLQSLPKADAPAGLAENVTASLDREIAIHRRAALMRWMHVGGWMSAAAAIIIVIQLAPWQPPRKSPTPSHRTTAEPELAATEAMEKDSAPTDSKRRVAPSPTMIAMKKEADERGIGTRGAKKALKESDSTQEIAKLDDLDAEGDAAAPGALGRKEAGVRSVAPGKGGERAAAKPGPAGKGPIADTETLRAVRRNGKAGPPSTNDRAGIANNVARARTPGAKTAAQDKAKGAGGAEAEAKAAMGAKDNAIREDAKSARNIEQPVPLTLTFVCADINTGRAAVLKAITAVKGTELHLEKKLGGMAYLTAADMIDARVPREKLPALVAALKLGGWSPPKNADKKPGAGPAGRAPVTVPFGAEAARKPGAASSKRMDGAPAARSQQDEQATTGEQATVQQADQRPAAATDTSLAGKEQQAPPTRQIRIFLKVKPNK